MMDIFVNSYISILKLAVVCLLLALTSGCYERFYYPKIYTDYGDEVYIQIDYKSGHTSKFYQRGCMAGFFGRPNDKIIKIKITRDDIDIYSLIALESGEGYLEREYTQPEVIINSLPNKMYLGDGELCYNSHNPN